VDDKTGEVCPITGTHGRHVNDAQVPLVVDVDGTLVRGDLLWDGLIRLAVAHPHRALEAAWSLLRGRAGLKAFVARVAGPDIGSVPLEPAVVRLIGEAKDQGRTVILASAAHVTLVSALAERVGADAAYGSDGDRNLKGPAKLEVVRDRHGEFDYVGNSSADRPLWIAAERAYSVSSSLGAQRRAKAIREDVIEIGTGRSLPAAVIHATRPLQWSKNLLLLLPAVAAHSSWSGALVWTMLAGFLSFSFLSSCVYVLNDLIDLPHDRAHVSKRMRPAAAGDISIPASLILAVALGTIAAALALAMPLEFQAVLAGYAILAAAYSLSLKRHTIVDVITLATLYAARVGAGAALAEVALSRWFLAFSVFFFVSLALVKRVAELLDKPDNEVSHAPGRAYVRSDATFLASFGSSAVAASALVYCLYITGDDVNRLYGAPDLLWLGLPLLLYWQGRVWLMTIRGKMVQDPVLFALRDRVSHVATVFFLIVVWLAR